MAETKSSETGKKGTGINPLLVVGGGCLVLLVVLGVLLSVAGGWLAKKVGLSFLQSAIEKNTGVKTSLSDIEKGKLSFTDEKTGSKVDIGSGKIPDSFPKDFPIYPGAKVTSVLSGSEKGKNNGFWVTLSTADSLDKVETYYKTNLTKNGWSETSSYSTGDTTTQTVTKGDLSGSVAITRASDAKETDIMIILGQDQSSSAPQGE